MWRAFRRVGCEALRIHPRRDGLAFVLVAFEEVEAHEVGRADDMVRAYEQPAQRALFIQPDERVGYELPLVHTAGVIGHDDRALPRRACGHVAHADNRRVDVYHVGRFGGEDGADLAWPAQRQRRVRNLEVGTQAIDGETMHHLLGVSLGVARGDDDHAPRVVVRETRRHFEGALLHAAAVRREVGGHYDERAFRCGHMSSWLVT